MKQLHIWPLGLTLVLLVFAGIQFTLVDIASTHFDGPDDEQYYNEGLHYDQDRDALEHGHHLGWSVQSTLDRDTVRLMVAQHGAPLHGATVQVTIGHPATRRDDCQLTLRETAPGHYEGHCTVAPGVWDVTSLVACQNERAQYHSRCRVP